MGAEAGADRPPAQRAVTTSVIVDAPPETVWRRVVAFPPLPEPRSMHFRAGIAYPRSATISAGASGAVRRCRFSTGDFVEPITVWDEPRRLAFSVTEQPAPMRELSVWGDVHPPHLDGFLRSRRGEFRLIPLPGDRTLLRGTTWYENRMWPAGYWRTLVRRAHQLDPRARARPRRAVGGGRPSRNPRTGPVASRTCSCGLHPGDAGDVQWGSGRGEPATPDVGVRCGLRPR